MFLAYDCNGANIERAEQTKMSAGNIEPNSTNSSGKKNTRIETETTFATGSS